MNDTKAKPLAEQSLPELMLGEGEYRAMRQRLVQEKLAIQQQLTEVNRKLTLKWPFAELQKLKHQRQSIIASLQAKEMEISEFNQERAEIETVMEIRKRQQFGIQQITALVALRDSWHEYSMDTANHQKAREVAFKVSQELRALLKPYFDSQAK